MTAYSGGDECETIDQISPATTAVTTLVAPSSCDFMKGMEDNAQKIVNAKMRAPRAKSAPNLLLSVSQLITPPERSLMEHELRKISLNSSPLNSFIATTCVDKNCIVDDAMHPRSGLMRLLSFCKPLTACCRAADEKSPESYDVNAHIKSGLSVKKLTQKLLVTLHETHASAPEKWIPRSLIYIFRCFYRTFYAAFIN